MDRENVASETVVTGVDRGRHGTVIHFVHARVGHVERTGCDVGGGAARGGHGVVVGIGAGQAHPCHVHGLAHASVVVCEGRRALDREDVASETVVTGGHRRTRCAVVGLVVSRESDVQGSLPHCQGARTAREAVAQCCKAGRCDRVAAGIELTCTGVGGRRESQGPGRITVYHARDRACQGWHGVAIGHALGIDGPGCPGLLPIDRIQARTYGCGVVGGRFIAVVAEAATARSNERGQPHAV